MTILVEPQNSGELKITCSGCGTIHTHRAAAISIQAPVPKTPEVVALPGTVQEPDPPPKPKYPSPTPGEPPVIFLLIKPVGGTQSLGEIVISPLAVPGKWDFHDSLDTLIDQFVTHSGTLGNPAPTRVRWHSSEPFAINEFTGTLSNRLKRPVEVAISTLPFKP